MGAAMKATIMVAEAGKKINKLIANKIVSSESILLLFLFSFFFFVIILLNSERKTITNYVIFNFRYEIKKREKKEREKYKSLERSLLIKLKGFQIDNNNSHKCAFICPSKRLIQLHFKLIFFFRYLQIEIFHSTLSHLKEKSLIDGIEFNLPILKRKKKHLLLSLVF